MAESDVLTVRQRLVLDLLEKETTTQTLISPECLLSDTTPVSSELAYSIKNMRSVLRAILQGQDPRLLVVVGPCSIHDVNAAKEYASLLKEAALQFADDLVIVMRTYFEKPRTTLGWKGLLSDPFLDGTLDMNAGLKLARHLLIELNDAGVVAATEFLDTFIPHYLSDLIVWSAIGARTSESQIHRELASGLSMPVGFKNNTDGNIKIAVDAASTARHSHPLLSISRAGLPTVIQTPGNPSSHIILRGSHLAPNYSIEHIHYALGLLTQANLPPYLIVDCSHGNSMKTYQNQCIVARFIAEQLRQGTTSICGVMLESNLVAGQQRLERNKPLHYGQSITDACISWEETVPLLTELALAAKKRKEITFT